MSLVRRIARIVLIGLCFLALAFVLGAVIPRPLLPPAGEVHATRRIAILHNPIHTDIALPIDAAVAQRFGFVPDAGLSLQTPGAVYLVFGWGGREFYLNTPQWSQLKASSVLAAFTVDRAVMHVGLLGDIPEDSNDVRILALSEDEYARLVDFIAASFSRDSAGPMPIKGAGYGPYDMFFEAEGRFNALVGCNTWTAAALRSAGLRTGWWTPLPLSLDLSLRLYEAARSQRGGVQP